MPCFQQGSSFWDAQLLAAQRTRASVRWVVGPHRPTRVPQTKTDSRERPIVNAHREAVGVIELQEEARAAYGLAQRLHGRGGSAYLARQQQERAAQASRAARSYYERWAATVGTRTKDHRKDEGHGRR